MTLTLPQWSDLSLLGQSMEPPFLAGSLHILGLSSKRKLVIGQRNTKP